MATVGLPRRITGPKISLCVDLLVGMAYSIETRKSYTQKRHPFIFPTCWGHTCIGRLGAVRAHPPGYTALQACTARLTRHHTRNVFREC